MPEAGAGSVPRRWPCWKLRCRGRSKWSDLAHGFGPSGEAVWLAQARPKQALICFTLCRGRPKNSGIQVFCCLLCGQFCCLLSVRLESPFGETESPVRPSCSSKLHRIRSQTFGPPKGMATTSRDSFSWNSFKATPRSRVFPYGQPRRRIGGSNHS